MENKRGTLVSEGRSLRICSSSELEVQYTNRGLDPQAEFKIIRTMFQLAVFDISRGNREGHEEEKIIAWSPSDTPLQEQLSNAGLLQAMLQLGGYFSDVRVLPERMLDDMKRFK